MARSRAGNTGKSRHYSGFSGMVTPKKMRGEIFRQPSGNSAIRFDSEKPIETAIRKKLGSGTYTTSKKQMPL